MIQDPTVGLRNAMAAADLYPGDIVWDGAFHRFPGAGKKKSNKSGWLQGIRRSQGRRLRRLLDGAYGSTAGGSQLGAHEVHAGGVGGRGRTAQEERAELEAKAIEEVKVVWKNAVKSPSKVLAHPYLKGKEIEGCERLRIFRQDGAGRMDPASCVLLVPMLVDKKPVNLQRIREDGQKRYWPKAPASGASLIIGGKYFREETTKTIYVCEVGRPHGPSPKRPSARAWSRSRRTAFCPSPRR